MRPRLDNIHISKNSDEYLYWLYELIFHYELHGDLFLSTGKEKNEMSSEFLKNSCTDGIQIRIQIV
jgi:hypothetical protein